MRGNIFFKFFFIFGWSGSWLQHAGSSSWAGIEHWPLVLGAWSLSRLLDHQRSPLIVVLNCSFADIKWCWIMLKIFSCAYWYTCLYCYVNFLFKYFQTDFTEKKTTFNILVYNSWPFLPMVYPTAYILGEVQQLNQSHSIFNKACEPKKKGNWDITDW